MSQSTNITWHDSEVTKEDRQHQNGHKSAVIWFTGLSGSVSPQSLWHLRRLYLKKINIHID